MTITASGQGALNFALLISRYIRQFLRVDPRVALQYVYSVCLSADQEGVGREQVEIAWELCRRVILMAEAGGGWEDLVGGYTPDGTRFVRHYPSSVFCLFKPSVDRDHRTRQASPQAARRPQHRHLRLHGSNLASGRASIRARKACQRSDQTVLPRRRPRDSRSLPRSCVGRLYWRRRRWRE